MSGQATVAVIGAGIVGAAVAYALASEGRKVLLLDRAEPGVAGASFGNVGHIATELVEPLPSPGLLLGFWRQLERFGGALDLPPGKAAAMLPWISRFAAAAFHRRANTRHLDPFVRPAVPLWADWLEKIGRVDLLERRGHFEVQLGRGSAAAAHAHAGAMQRLGIDTRPMRDEELAPIRAAARAGEAAGLWYGSTGHMLDPLEAVRALVKGAVDLGATVSRSEVRAVQARGAQIEILGARAAVLADAAVVCAGIDAGELLWPLGVSAPLEGVRGYHVECPGAKPLADAPVVYARQSVVVTPMRGRLRASSYMEFAAKDAPPDPRKPERLRTRVRLLGYPFEPEGKSWMGARPVLPDYLPGIGRVAGTRIFYAVGHQHVGLTTAPMTGLLVADLVAERETRIPVGAFDLRRFGRGR